jgi:glycerophosphoryl diester phosphodiesterase
MAFPSNSVAAPISTTTKSIGHRGNQALYPENVIVGLSSGLKISDGVETYFDF